MLSSCFQRFLAAATLCLLAQPQLVRAQMPAFDQAVVCGTETYGVSHLATDSAGNRYVTGNFFGTQVFGSFILTAVPSATSQSYNAFDVYVAKLDAAGNYVWVTQLSSPEADEGRGVAVDPSSGDVLVTGYFAGYSLSVNGGGAYLFNSSADAEAFVFKLNGATGQVRWGKRAGGTGYEQGSTVAVNAAGEVFVAGSFTSITADFGPVSLTNYTNFGQVNRKDVFISKLSPAGIWQWTRQAGGNGDEQAYRLLLDGVGGLYLLADIRFGASRFGPTTFTTNIAPGLLSGDAVIAKLDEQGNWQWAVQGDAVAHNNILGAGGFAYDGNGHLYIAGAFQSPTARLGPFVLTNRSTPVYNGAGGTPYWWYPSDGFVARLNAQTGAWEWVSHVGGTGEDGLWGLAADTQGRVYVSGNFASPLPGGGQANLAQLDGATGNWRWTGALGPNIMAMALGPGGKLSLGGSVQQTTANFPPLTLTVPSRPLSAGFVARLGAAGPLRTATRAGEAGFSVWPNPAADRAVWVGGARPGQAVRLTDALGREVLRAVAPARGPLSLTLPPGLPPGLYLVRSQAQTSKLVVQ